MPTTPFKQKSIQTALVIWLRAFFYTALWISCTASPGVGSAQTVNSTLGDQVANLRLIAAPGLADGVYRAGVDIVMAPGSHTYWTQPGDAGVPPVFAFNGSRNVATAEVMFPAPSRISEEGIEAFGYADKVVFPVVVTPIDRTRPAILKVDVSYAVCNKICIPAHGAATLGLTPNGVGLDGAKVTSAFAAVPMPLSGVDRHDLSITPDKGASKPSWTVTWSGPNPVEDVFAVAPEGFYFATKKLGANKFKLVAAEVASSAKTTQVPVSLILAGKEKSVVATELLDVTVVIR